MSSRVGRTNSWVHLILPSHLRMEYERTTKRDLRCVLIRGFISLLQMNTSHVSLPFQFYCKIHFSCFVTQVACPFLFCTCHLFLIVFPHICYSHMFLLLYLLTKTRSTEISQCCLISASCLKRYFARGNFILNIPCSVPYFSLLKIAPPPSQCVSVLCHLHNWTSSGIRGSHPGADCRHQDLHPVPPSWGRTTGHLATGKAVAVWNHQRTEAKSRHKKSLWRGHVLPVVVL